MRNAAAAPHLRVVAAAPDAACQGQPAAGPRPARPPSPGRPHFRLSRPSQSPGHGGDASRSEAPSRTEVGPQSPSALVQTGGLGSCARLKQAGPRQARGPFPWQQRGLRRPTAAKPRCVTPPGHPGSKWSLPGYPGSAACPYLILPPNLSLRKSTPFHLASIICLPQILVSSKYVLYLVPSFSPATST